MSERTSYFSFSASGSALGGMITSPSPLTVPTQAMAALSPSGGFGTATVENFSFERYASFRRATATVQGDQSQTEVTVTLEDLNIMDILTASRIVMHLVSRVPAGAKEASISPAGSLIEGLQVHGKSVALDSRIAVFDRYPSLSGLQEGYLGGQLQGLILEPGSLSALCTAKSLNGCETPLGDVKATLFALPGPTGGLRIKDFATVYFGEYRISKFARRLTMLRVELGCGTEGSLSAGEGSGNGHWEPPF